MFFSRSSLGVVKHILHYLQGTNDHGLLFQKSIALALITFTDVDWALFLEDRRSTNGYCVFLGTNPMSWSSKKQHTASRSSTKVEYRCVENATSKIV